MNPTENPPGRPAGRPAGRTAAARFPRLTAADLTNLAMEYPDTPMHMGVLVLLDGRALCDADGKLRLAEIRAMAADRVRDVPELCRIVHVPGLLAGPPLWIDYPALRIDQHVNEVGLPPPGDEAALLCLAEELLAPLLDRSRPMWRVWFVTGLPGGRVGAVVALHHAIADGLGAVRLLATLLGAPLAAAVPTVPAPTVPAPTVPVPTVPVPTVPVPTVPVPAVPVPVGQAPTGPAAGRALVDPVTAPRWAELVRDNARARASAARRRLATAPSPRRCAGSVRSGWRVLAQSWRAPRTSLNAPIGPRRRLAVFHLDLADAKRIAHGHGGKVNDVILNLAAGSLRALLRARGESVDGVSLRASVAVSLRAPGGNMDAGNHVGVVIVRLPVGEADPDLRMEQVCAESIRAKQGQVPTAGQGVAVWAARLGLLRRFTRRQHLTNLTESNMIGPPAPIRLLGAPVVDLIPIGNLAGNLSVTFLALSYAGRIAVAVRADADQYPDLPVLMAALENDWNQLAAR